jgi:uncharacterized protein
VNVCSPHPVTNASFTAAFASALHRPAIIPLPAAAVEVGLGEMGRETMLVSQRMVPRKLAEGGFEWEVPRVEDALRRVLA